MPILPLAVKRVQGLSESKISLEISMNKRFY